MAVIGLFVSSIFLIQACGWFESDSIDEEKNLFDNFKVIKYKDDPGSGAQIVIKYNENEFEIIQNKCQDIYFDSSQLYAKCIKFDSVFEYIHILKSLGEGQRPRFSKIEMKESEYIKRINQGKYRHLIFSK